MRAISSDDASVRSRLVADIWPDIPRRQGRRLCPGALHIKRLPIVGLLAAGLLLMAAIGFGNRRPRSVDQQEVEQKINVKKVAEDRGKDQGSSNSSAAAASKPIEGMLLHAMDLIQPHDAHAQSGPAEAGPEENAEWEVISVAPVNVRSAASLTARIVDRKTHGKIVIGRREPHSWVRLAGGTGYMKSEIDDSVLLEKRVVSYEKITTGTCADIGMHPLRDGPACEVAAVALGLPDITVQEQLFVLGAPEGCYLKDEKELWLSINPNTKGNGAVVERHPICASQGYPELPTTPTTSTVITTPAVMATTVTTRPAPGTSGTLPISNSTGAKSDFLKLLCFSVMTLHGYEHDLMKEQLRRGVGIFACDTFIVISTGKYLLGSDINGDMVYTWENPEVEVKKGNAQMVTNSFLNVEVFQMAFRTIVHDEMERWKRADWIAKVDPDAVFFPDRLRRHLAPKTPKGGAAQYVLNCDNAYGGALYGSLEVFSQKAMQLFKDGENMCVKKLHWQTWGEDYFMQRCMDELGVVRLKDFKLVGDDRCVAADCADQWRVAFHPYKDSNSYFNCWSISSSMASAM
mmetsp:Transcript_22965/g.48823  ORF Transcript_22965/g.48823 Transcript_22965/m.48823 type:complete len:574 (-) Transcript_22965:134-1855(-)